MFNVFAMDSIDREFAIAEKAYDVAMAEVAYLEAMIDAKLRINMAKSELKVMTESTEETAHGDLVFLFNEAGKDAEAQGEGLFAKIKKAVLTFMISAWNSIQKIFTKEDTEAYKKLQNSNKKIKLPLNVKFFADKGEQIASAMDDADPADGKVAKIAKIIGATVVTAGGIAGVTALINKAKEAATTETEITEGEAVGIMGKLKNILPKFPAAVKNANEDSSDKEGILGKLLGFGKQVFGWITKGINAIRKALHLDIKDTDEVDGNEQPVTKPTKDGDPDQKSDDDKDLVRKSVEEFKEKLNSSEPDKL